MGTIPHHISQQLWNLGLRYSKGSSTNQRTNPLTCCHTRGPARKTAEETFRPSPCNCTTAKPVQRHGCRGERARQKYRRIYRQSPCKDTAVEAKEPDKTTEEKSGKAGTRASTRPRPKSPTNQPRNTPARPFKKNGRNQRFRHTLNTVDDAVDYQAPTVRGTQRARTRRRHAAA